MSTVVYTYFSISHKMALKGAYEEKIGFSLGNTVNKSDTRPYLGSPRGIALNEDIGIMYVCDMFGNTIHVFTMDGTHITCFGNHFLNQPWGVLIYKDLLFVTDVVRQSVIMFRGCTQEEVRKHSILFKFPRGMAISSKTEELFITDEDKNHVVVCSINPLRYTRVFVDKVPSPYDVNVCPKTDSVYVLKIHSPSILKFNLAGKLLETLFKGDDFSGSWFFCLSPHYDSFFIISQYKKSDVNIYNRNEKLLQKINFKSSVFGVAITSDLNIIVASYEDDKIKIFSLIN